MEKNEESTALAQPQQARRPRPQLESRTLDSEAARHAAVEGIERGAALVGSPGRSAFKASGTGTLGVINAEGEQHEEHAPKKAKQQEQEQQQQQQQQQVAIAAGDADVQKDDIPSSPWVHDTRTAAQALVMLVNVAPDGSSSSASAAANKDEHDGDGAGVDKGGVLGVQSNLSLKPQATATSCSNAAQSPSSPQKTFQQCSQRPKPLIQPSATDQSTIGSIEICPEENVDEVRVRVYVRVCVHLLLPFCREAARPPCAPRFSCSSHIQPLGGLNAAASVGAADVRAPARARGHNGRCRQVHAAVGASQEEGGHTHGHTHTCMSLRPHTQEHTHTHTHT